LQFPILQTSWESLKTKSFWDFSARTKDTSGADSQYMQLSRTGVNTEPSYKDGYRIPKYISDLILHQPFPKFPYLIAGERFPPWCPTTYPEPRLRADGFLWAKEWPSERTAGPKDQISGLLPR